MLTVQENQELTSVGKGTPVGDLMRRYWQPIAPTAELDQRPAKEIRVLGEDLVLFRDLQGRCGLVDRYCAHRRVDLSYGIPEEQGLRCMYHGWMYDTSGQCVEQPFEETVHPVVSRPDSGSGSSEGVVKPFKEKVKLTGYPVQEYGGLIWAYLGPPPAPVLPMWEPFLWEHTVRDIAISILPCNWLQAQENSLDPVHLEWLHSYYGEYVRSVRGGDGQWAVRPPKFMKHLKIGFDVFDNGIIKRRVLTGKTEADDDWAVGHPILFPNVLFVGDEVMGTLQYRVPIDERHTFHVSYYVWKAAPGHAAPAQQRVPYRYVPLREADGRFIIDFTFNQDYMSWLTQGEINDRTQERLGESDRGIILYRRLLKEQAQVSADGGQPMNVFHDPDAAHDIKLPLERVKFGDSALMFQYRPPEAGESGARQEIEEVLKTWRAYQHERMAPLAAR